MIEGMIIVVKTTQIKGYFSFRGGNKTEGQIPLNDPDSDNLKALASCNPLDVHKRYVAFSPFHTTQVGTIQATDVGKLLLGHPQLGSPLADRVAKPEPNSVHERGASYLSALLLMCPRTMSIICSARIPRAVNHSLADPSRPDCQ